MSVVVVVVVFVAVVLFGCVCLRVLVCSVIQEAWCPVTRARCLPPAPKLLSSIEERAYCGVKLLLAVCCSWVGRWDGGGLGAVLLLCCCVLFAVAVVVAVVLIFACVYLCLRVLVCSVIVGARRSVTRA